MSVYISVFGTNIENEIIYVICHFISPLHFKTDNFRYFSYFPLLISSSLPFVSAFKIQNRDIDNDLCDTGCHRQCSAVRSRCCCYIKDDKIITTTIKIIIWQ
jgi:hypothetical protein